MTARKIKGPAGIWLELDEADAATPALVCAHFNGIEITSTYDCAMGNGFIDDQLELSAAQTKWLEAQIDDVEYTYDIARKDSPEYQ